ncbi:MAG: hypothetical protein GHCLOJNM_03761 [bacterium]|nr:hypothetical protein [bacterium]
MKRRDMIQLGLGSLAYFTTERTTPNWIIRSAEAIPNPGGENRILVIVQQAGGNDGLNTVIPRTDPVYYDPNTRGSLIIPAGMEINLDGLNGFHPKLARLANWYQNGHLAIVQNVGYPNPNLSHFTSTDYWERGSVPGVPLPTQGWVARFYDNTCAGMPDPYALQMMASGLSDVPDSLEGTTGYTTPAILQASTYALTTDSDAALRRDAIAALNSIATTDPRIDFLQRSESTAEASAEDIAAAASVAVLGNYPAGTFGEGLKLASQVIRAGFPTRIFYVSQNGYDTHANQVGPDPVNTGDHQELLDAFDQALDAFLFEMQTSGNLDRVLMLTFSEFGRRVAGNGSLGCDHGAGNCLMALGGRVAGGVYGGQPDLTDLIKGNLKYTVDFRAVYSEVLEAWFEADPTPVFGESYDLSGIQFIQGVSSVSGWRLY